MTHFNEEDVARNAIGRFSEQHHGEPVGLALAPVRDGGVSDLEAAIAESEGAATRHAAREAELEAEVARLKTSDRHPVIARAAAIRREQLDRIGAVRQDVAAQAQRLYQEAGAQHAFHYAHDMLKPVSAFHPSDRHELRTKKMVFKVKKRGPDADATLRAQELAKTDPGYQDAVAAEQQVIDGIKTEDAELAEAYRSCAAADRRRYELQQEARTSRLARETAEREATRARIELEHTIARQEAGIGEHSYPDPRKADPGLSVDPDGNLNAWVYRDGAYLRAVEVARNDGNVRTANKLILEDGSTAAWGSHWSRLGPGNDETTTAGILLTTPHQPGSRPLAEITGAAGLWCETDSSD